MTTPCIPNMSGYPTYQELMASYFRDAVILPAAF
jgi:hypothetical protein